MRMEYWLSADAPFYVDDLTVAGYAADEEYPPRKQCGEGKTFGYVKFKASGGESITVLVKDVDQEKSPTDYIKVYYDFGEEEVDVNDVSYSLVYSEDEDCVIVSFTGMSVAEVTSESGEVQWQDQGDGTVWIWNPDRVEVTVRFIP